MSEKLTNGFKIKTLFGGEITVKHFLAEGGQGAVYVVDYNGEEKALKWYKPIALGDNPYAFYENLKSNAERKKPSEEFLWPLDVTEQVGNTFGYVMDLRPEGYYEITEFMLCHVRFRSFRSLIDAAMSIVSAFRILHNAGYSYQDMNDGNFFINPNNGKVLICDNDNVAPDRAETGIIGKPRYMAPEIVLGKSKPNSLTDRFSMSLILYILFCLNHPLEGKRYLVSGLTPALQEKLYGSEPLFMMDPNDSSNGPHPVIHKNSLAIWPCLPEYVQKIFLDAFSQKAFQNPNVRPKEIDWLNVLTRFRSDIVQCCCGNEVFTQQGEDCKCDVCGKDVKIPFKLELSNYSIPAVKGSRLYRCQLGVCDASEALNPVASVLQKEDSGILGIKNKYGKRWDAVTTKGIAKKVAPDEVIPLKDGIKFTVENETIVIKENIKK